MRVLSILGAVLALGKLTYAEDCLGVALTAIPNCAQSCFLNGAPSVGCGGTDFDCQCAQEAALYAAVEGCVSSSCPEASFQAVIDGASTVCACATPAVGGGGVVVGGSGSVTVSGIVGSMTASVPASVSATLTSGGTASTTVSSAGGGIGGGGVGWTPSTVSNVATASSISAGNHQMTYDLRFMGYVAAIVIAALTTMV